MDKERLADIFYHIVDSWERLQNELDELHKYVGELEKAIYAEEGAKEPEDGLA